MRLAAQRFPLKFTPAKAGAGMALFLFFFGENKIIEEIWQFCVKIGARPKIRFCGGGFIFYNKEKDDEKFDFNHSRRLCGFCGRLRGVLRACLES